MCRDRLIHVLKTTRNQWAPPISGTGWVISQVLLEKLAQQSDKEAGAPRKKMGSVGINDLNVKRKTLKLTTENVR